MENILDKYKDRANEFSGFITLYSTIIVAASVLIFISISSSGEAIFLELIGVAFIVSGAFGLIGTFLTIFWKNKFVAIINGASIASILSFICGVGIIFFVAIITILESLPI